MKSNPASMKPSIPSATRYGRRVIYYGHGHDSRESAPLRISFTHIPVVEVEG